MRKLIILSIYSLVFISCLKDKRECDFNKDAISSTLKVSLVLPAGVNTSLDGMKVKFVETFTGLEYSGVSDANGTVLIDVAYGTYTGVINITKKEDGEINVYNGSTEPIRVTPKDPKVIETKLDLRYSRSGKILIKEFYYAGCWNDATNKAYVAKDYYFTLYNNTDEVVYLDSVCVAIVNPLNAPTNGKLTDWVKPGTTELRDELPAGTMVWMFKGNGKDLPLNPGTEIVCSPNAIDHTKTVAKSVNLGKDGYFALYDPVVTTAQSTPEPGVNTLELMWRTGPSKAFAISVSSPGLFIFKLGGKTPKEFINETLTNNPSNPNNVANRVLLVDKNLIIDGVECLKNPSDTKRIRPEVDNGYAIISTTGTGKSIIRKVDTERTVPGGPIFYIDTNNSTNDFEVIPFATLTGKN